VEQATGTMADRACAQTTGEVLSSERSGVTFRCAGCDAGGLRQFIVMDITPREDCDGKGTVSPWAHVSVAVKEDGTNEFPCVADASASVVAVSFGRFGRTWQEHRELVHTAQLPRYFGQREALGRGLPEVCNVEGVHVLCTQECVAGDGSPELMVVDAQGTSPCGTGWAFFRWFVVVAHDVRASVSCTISVRGGLRRTTEQPVPRVAV
jgi:hypothetical protein